MNGIITAILQHPYSVIFLVVLAEAVGLPAPAAVALVGGGAAASAHALSIPLAFMVAMIALLLGDVLLFFVGRYTGWGLLSFLCSLSMNPETCILRSAESFYKRGRVTLIFAKFIPGVNTMAPPLAGSMKMKFQQFLLLDLLGGAIYIVGYGALGFLFRDFVERISRGLQSAGHIMAEVIISALAAYALYRILQYRGQRLQVSFREWTSKSWQSAWPRRRERTSSWLMFAATDITMPALPVLPARSVWSRTACPMKSLPCLTTKTFIFTALERAKPPAPVWRCYSGKQAFGRL